MRIAVFSPNLIGDTVMATPTFRALRDGFPDARITLVARPSVAPVLAGNPWFDETVVLDHRSKTRGRRTMAVASELWRERPDLALLLPNSFRSALTARLAGCRRVVGYRRGGRSWLLSDGLDPPRDRSDRFLPTPAVEYYAALSRHLGCPARSLRLALFTTHEDERAADAAWDRLGLERMGRPVVCLNTGGAFGPAKVWPEASFAALGRRLAVESGASVLMLCGPVEREAARRIVEGADHPSVVGLHNEPLSLGLSKASVRRSALLVTTDSGPRHFAAAFGIPVVTLFGPTDIAWTRTNHPFATHLRLPLECSPCQRPVCPLGHQRCLRDLTPEAVFEAAIRLLGAGSVKVDASPVPGSHPTVVPIRPGLVSGAGR